MTSSSVTTTSKKNKQSLDHLNRKDDPAYHQKDLFLPKNRVSYFIYKPASSLPPNSPIHFRVLNYLQLVYYKYQLATGLYMLNENERAFINFIVLASSVLTFYHFIL